MERKAYHAIFAAMHTMSTVLYTLQDPGYTVYYCWEQIYREKLFLGILIAIHYRAICCITDLGQLHRSYLPYI